MIKSLYLVLHNSIFCCNFAPAFGNAHISLSQACCDEAALAELVDAPDLGSGSERSESSSLLCRTTDLESVFLNDYDNETFFSILTACIGSRYDIM